MRPLSRARVGRRGTTTSKTGGGPGAARLPLAVRRQPCGRSAATTSPLPPADSVSLDDRREVCRNAASAAKAGDAKARDWLARYPLGEKPLDLVTLAADE